MRRVTLKPLAPRKRYVVEALLVAITLFLVFIGYGCCVNNRWYLLLVVNSESMSPTFNAGDMILVTRPPRELEPGMIVTFQIEGRVVTHRVVEIAEGGCIRTKGDANEGEDVWPDELQITEVAGVCRVRFPYLGYILNFPRTIFTSSYLSDVETSSPNVVQAGTWHNPHPPTETPEPTETIEPTETPTLEPTETVEPTQEPTETPTEEPGETATPEPTETVEPTPEPTETEKVE